jgi:hypothetical protein
MTESRGDATCRNCWHFRNDPEFLEATFKGMSAMSSAWASVRAEDGICLKHERYLSPDAFCADFSLVTLPLAATKRSSD